MIKKLLFLILFLLCVGPVWGQNSPYLQGGPQPTTINNTTCTPGSSCTVADSTKAPTASPTFTTSAKFSFLSDGYVPYYSSTNGITNSPITVSGTNVGIGTTVIPGSPRLGINGTVGVYGLATDASNYQMGLLFASNGNGTLGSTTLTCARAGTGAANCDVNLTPLGTGVVTTAAALKAPSIFHPSYPTNVGLSLSSGGLALYFNNTLTWDGNTFGPSAAATLGTTTKRFGLFGAAINTATLTINTSSTPASTDACAAGQMTWDASYIYVCTATGAWKRATLNAY